MIRNIILIFILLFIYNLNADYIFCENSQEGKQKIKEYQKKLLLVTFINENDSALQKDLEKKYIDIAKNFSDTAHLILIKFTKDKDLLSKYDLKRLPSNIILKDGIPVNGFKGVYPVDAIQNLLNLSLH